MREAWSHETRPAFLQGIGSPKFYQGLRDNCLYTGDVHVPTKARFVLNIQAEDDSLVVVDAAVDDPGKLDEYQLSCVAQWLTGTRIAARGVDPGSRYRVLMQVAM